MNSRYDALLGWETGPTVPRPRPARRPCAYLVTAGGRHTLGIALSDAQADALVEGHVVKLQFHNRVGEFAFVEAIELHDIRAPGSVDRISFTASGAHRSTLMQPGLVLEAECWLNPHVPRVRKLFGARP